MFHHILLATDFSAASERAAELAAGLARALRARVTVVHVYETADAASLATAVAAERTWPRAIRARAEIDRIVAGLCAGGVNARGALRFGLLPHRLTEIARELGADLVVTGTHARRGVARLWRGSVSEQLLRHSPIPVLAAVPREGGDDVPERVAQPTNVVQLRRG